MKNKPALSQFSLCMDPVPWPSLNLIAEFRITAAGSGWTLGSLFMGLEPFPGGVFCSFNGNYMKYVIFSCFCIHGHALFFQASGKRPRRLVHLGENELDDPPSGESENGIVNFNCLLRNVRTIKKFVRTEKL